MPEAKSLVDCLLDCGAGLFTGVPDSLLSKFSACVMQLPMVDHIIAANEGNAIGLAIGDYLATNKPAVVYMQNSGLGNTVNPLTSLVDPDVYGIPMMLVIGWRGEPGIHDEPQHIKQGAITLGQLNVLNIPYLIVNADTELDKVKALWEKMLKRRGPAALVVRKGAITGDWKVPKKDSKYLLKRETAIKILTQTMPEDTFFAATTGKAGRELYEIRESQGYEHRDFLTVGGMGHASCIALGVARHQRNRWTVCLDGDGAALMHLGASSTICTNKPGKFLHVILNNASHESVGGQPTVADKISFSLFAKAMGYDGYCCAETELELQTILREVCSKQKGTWMLEIKLIQGARKDLGRPQISPQQNKLDVMNFLGQPND